MHLYDMASYKERVGGKGHKARATERIHEEQGIKPKTTRTRHVGLAYKLTAFVETNSKLLEQESKATLH